MVGFIPKLPRKTWVEIIRLTLVVTLAAAVISVTVAAALMHFLNGSIDFTGMAVALTMAVTLAPPGIVVLSVRHRQLEITNTELRKLAYTDIMLNCMNRHGFTSSIDIGLQYASPHRPCALLVIDADNFKQINDQFGHDQGDKALRKMVDAIKSAIRAGDILGRIGGEEFGVFLPSTDDKHARAIAERICSTVAAIPFVPDGESHPLSVSVGGAVAVEPMHFSKLYRTADKHLYAAKQSGRNRADFAKEIIGKSSDTAA